MAENPLRDLMRTVVYNKLGTPEEDRMTFESLDVLTRQGTVELPNEDMKLLALQVEGVLFTRKRRQGTQNQPDDPYEVSMRRLYEDPEHLQEKLQEYAEILPRFNEESDRMTGKLAQQLEPDSE